MDDVLRTLRQVAIYARLFGAGLGLGAGYGYCTGTAKMSEVAQ